MSRDVAITDAAQYVTLGIASELLAVPVERVQEILESRQVSRLPHAPESLLGLIDVRGMSVPVVDLRLKLGFPQSEDTHDTRIVVLFVEMNGRQLTFGLKADRVFEVTVLDSSELEASPEVGMEWQSECIAGIGRRNGNFVTVLDLDSLFDGAEASFGVLTETDNAEVA
ncbi:chemotaxis protein CheW [Emcibacter nanhaiensis]|uniref:Chemotaxis protein CheW n=1 Tax=Emcibacter nanhaiensis TaxID=1505037 RepID=A0A501PLT8_9PROT|nr:chemotaxis protein CheW [Emcibacter nanhaiensis]TPD60736.1 chemotaxis protein CheW [Emcibacter nanhaiensis]